MPATIAIDFSKVRWERGDGQTGVQVYEGIGSFSTTDTTAELMVPFKTIKSVLLTPIGAFDADDQLSVDETVANGVIARPASGAITITRNSSGTSGGSFSFRVTGY